jgi:putative transposase
MSIDLDFGNIYHVYNRANGNEILFKEHDNYLFFLQKFKFHILPFSRIFAYCLMPNHFHVLLSVRQVEEIDALKEMQEIPPHWVSKQFSNLFSSYTQAFNKMYGRKGSLFMKNFKRKRVDDEDYFLKLVHYIHFNPVVAELIVRPEQWYFSSYSAILSKSSTVIERAKVLESFGGRENFIHCHSQPPSLTGIDW